MSIWGLILLECSAGCFPLKNQEERRDKCLAGYKPSSLLCVPVYRPSHLDLPLSQLPTCMFVEFCVVVDKDQEGDNAVVGPVPLMQDAANQDIRE